MLNDKNIKLIINNVYLLGTFLLLFLMIVIIEIINNITPTIKGMITNLNNIIDRIANIKIAKIATIKSILKPSSLFLL